MLSPDIHMNLVCVRFVKNGVLPFGLFDELGLLF